MHEIKVTKLKNSVENLTITVVELIERAEFDFKNTDGAKMPLNFLSRL